MWGEGLRLYPWEDFAVSNAYGWKEQIKDGCHPMKNGFETEQDMTRVITYGTFDLLHEGHYRLLERAKALGDYLIVGVTSEA